MRWNPLCILGMFSRRTSVEKRALEISRTSKLGHLSCREKLHKIQINANLKVKWYCNNYKNVGNVIILPLLQWNTALTSWYMVHSVCLVHGTLCAWYMVQSVCLVHGTLCVLGTWYTLCAWYMVVCVLGTWYTLCAWYMVQYVLCTWYTLCA